jgi:3-hydroxybutyryl-CoA dehydrogenase
VAAGYLGRKSGRGFHDYGPDAARPAARSEAPQPAPSRIVLHGDPGIAMPLVGRIAAAAVAIQRQPGRPGFPDGVLAIGDAWLALSDGRTATARAAATGAPNLVLFDLALDYASCLRLAVAAADGCDPAAFATAIGALQAAGIAVSRLDDVAGLAVLRTVAMLGNEAADAVTMGIASAADVDTAMRKGVNYPRGPLAWADAVGVGRIREVIGHLQAHYGEDRYRISPLIARRHARAAMLVPAAAEPKVEPREGTAT